MKHLAISAGLAILGRTGAARLAAPWTRGQGVILMLHHVRPYVPRDFEPNRILEITPEFLDGALGHLSRLGYELIALGDLPERLRRPRGRFAALTFDDGYRDNLVHALPVLERHQAPFTIFVVAGFADRTATLWWEDLEEALDRLEAVDLDGRELPLDTPRRKAEAFSRLIRRARSLPWAEAAGMIRRIVAAARVDAAERVDRYCLDWREIRALDAHPLCALAPHTLTHPVLGQLSAAEARAEIEGSKARLEEMLGRPMHHFAYPVGDAAAAGPREFALAREAGFLTAVTTRPGVVHADHAAHLHALPRLSLNGLHQSIGAFDALLTGAPFALLNRGRRLNVG